MADESTSFTEKVKSGGGKKAIVAGGTGLSAAALIYLHAVFATKSDIDSARQTISVQWKQLSELRKEVSDLKQSNAAYQHLLEFLTTGNVRAIIGTTGKTNL